MGRCRDHDGRSAMPAAAPLTGGAFRRHEHCRQVLLHRRIARDDASSAFWQQCKGFPRLPAHPSAKPDPVTFSFTRAQVNPQDRFAPAPGQPGVPSDLDGGSCRPGVVAGLVWLRAGVVAGLVWLRGWCGCGAAAADRALLRHLPRWHRPYQNIRCECPIHAAGTTWLGHPRRINRWDSGRQVGSPATIATAITPHTSSPGRQGTADPGPRKAGHGGPRAPEGRPRQTPAPGPGRQATAGPGSPRRRLVTPNPVAPTGSRPPGHRVLGPGLAVPSQGESDPHACAHSCN